MKRKTEWGIYRPHCKVWLIIEGDKCVASYSNDGDLRWINFYNIEFVSWHNFELTDEGRILGD